MNDIPKLFLETRRAYNKSQAAFAPLIGCSRVSLSTYETGAVTPSADKYERLLELRAQLPDANPTKKVSTL